MTGSCQILIAVLVLATASAAKESPPSRPSFHLDHYGAKWAERTLHKMTVEEKVGQVFMIWCRAAFLNVDNPDYLQLRDSMRKYHVGGFAMTVRWEPPFLYRSQPYEAAELLNRLQADSSLPLLIAADFERGLSMRLTGTTEFPHAMAFGAAGDPKLAEEFGRITAQESRAIGVHWNFFPDADVNSNPANPIINTRSFGEDPLQVGQLVAAYIHGAHEGGMMTTAKHFPGHGDTSTDSHLSLAQVTGDRARLNSVELPPFEQAIAAGTDAIMVAHVSVPSLEPDPNRVATTSPAIVSGLLKEQLGFKGIVVSDALDMAGLTRLYANDIGRAAVDAFKAGSDVLLIPADLDASYRAMLAAVHSGEIPMSRLNASVLKLLQAKASLGLEKNRLVDIGQLATAVGKPENIAFGQQVADSAVTLVRDNGKVLPLKSEGTPKPGLPYQSSEPVSNRLVVVIMTDDVRTETGRTLERQIRSRMPDANVIYVDPRIADAVAADVLKAVDEAEAVIAAVYVVPTPGKPPSTAVTGNAATPANHSAIELAEDSGDLLHRILYHGVEKTVVLAMGSPYIAQDLPKVQNYLCAFSSTTVSEISAAKALFGEIPIHGHLPVSIPNIAARGAGIERPVQLSSGDSSHAHH
jgi:beta-N-acetylhexosaminidase